MLRLPDVRLTDIVTRVVTGDSDFCHEGEALDRAMLFFALKGDFQLDLPGSGGSTVIIREGTAVGLQSGRRHVWTATSAKGPRELFSSSIQRKAGLVQGLDHETIVVPPHVEPSATIIRLAVTIHLTEHRSRTQGDDDLIIRRCAEIVMTEFVRFARASVVGTGEVPIGIAHDEYLLRAWSAYYAAPRDRWTVKALAQAAGLSRTAFAERFRNAVGVPPLTAISDLRLQQAVTMLCEERTPLIEVAFTVGYNSEAAFVRAFSRKYGMPPGRFRHERTREAA
jgi:AraC-like DNA-binding protein